MDISNLRPGQLIWLEQFRVDAARLIHDLGLGAEVREGAVDRLRRTRLTLNFAIDGATQFIPALSVSMAGGDAGLVRSVAMIMRDKSHLVRELGCANGWGTAFRPETISASEELVLENQELRRALDICEVPVVRGHPGEDLRYAEGIITHLRKMPLSGETGITLSRSQAGGLDRGSVRMDIAHMEAALLRRVSLLNLQVCPEHAGARYDAMFSRRLRPAPSKDMLRLAFGIEMERGADAQSRVA